MIPVRRTWALAALVFTLALAACNEVSSGSGSDDDGNRAPTLSLTASPATGVAPYNAVLSANADDPDGDDLTYVWTTPEGSVVSGAQFSLTLPTPGSYAVSVTVSDGALDATESVTLSATAAESVPGNEAPTVGLELSTRSGPAPLTVRLEAETHDPDGDDLKLLWGFGDGTAATSGTVQSHTYEEPGTYRARVTVSDGRGGSATATETITVGEGEDDGDNDGNDGGEEDGENGGNDGGDDGDNDGGATTGTLRLDVFPEDAIWYVDDGRSGEDVSDDEVSETFTGDGQTTLPAGEYEVVVQAQNGAPYRAERVPVTITAGRETSTRILLEKDEEAVFDASLDFGYNDGGAWFVTQGGTLEVTVSTDEDYDVGENGFTDFAIAIEGGGTLGLTLERSYRDIDGRVFVYTTSFDPALTGQELGYTPTANSPYAFRFIEEVNMLYFSTGG